MKRILGWAAAAGLAALLLERACWGLAGSSAELLWVQPAPWVHGAFFAAGAAWACAWAAFGRMGFDLPAEAGARAGGLGALPWALGLAWHKVVALPLPPPHDQPERKLAIFIAGLLIGGLALSLGSFLWSCYRAQAWRRFSPRSMALRLGGLAWGIYLLSGLWGWRWTMTGDAPFYMMMSASLSRGEGIDMAPAFKAAEWKKFYDLDRTLVPQEDYQKNGAYYCEHRPLLSILVEPGYAIAGVLGALALLTLIGALGSGLFYLLLRARGFSPEWSFIGWAVFAFSTPWWTFSQAFYVEMLAGALSLAWLCADIEVLPLTLAWFLPPAILWTGLRFIPLAGALALASTWRERRSTWRRWAPLFFLGLGYAGYAWMAHAHIGDADPLAMYKYKSRAISVQQIFSPWGAPWHFIGVLLDQEFGLLPWAAPLMLAFTGAAVLVRRRDPLLAPLGLWLLPYGTLICVTQWWWGGMAPNRYVICLVPALCFLAMEGWRAWGWRPWTLGLAALGWGAALLMQVLPWFCFSKQDGASWPLKILGKAAHLPLPSLFPSFMILNAACIPWSLAFIVLCAILIRRAYRP